MELFNSLENRREELRHNPNGKFTMYFCGPTVYNYAHIGNFRTYLLQDVLTRTLEVNGYNPCVARNITDVDDKTIRDSIKNNVSLKTFTEKWTKIFHEDCEALNIKIPDFEPKATEHINEQIDMIKVLMDKGFAYLAQDNSVYFRIASFEKYGALSNVGNRELKTQKFDSAGKKNLADEYDRENVSDFALWKSTKPEDGENFWMSPWGKGRPGWHIECSAMAKKYLGDTIDLHSGGIDLKFPHHENEIAQSECANGKKFVRYWMHVAHLLVDGSKMSKSLGNLYTLGDIMKKGYSAQCLRYALISAHYSQQLNFTLNNLVAAKNAVEKLQRFFHEISPTWNVKKFEIAEWKFLKNAFFALLDDMNTPACLGNIFKLVNEVSFESLNEKQKNELCEEFSTVMYCLGLRLDDKDQDVEIPEKIKILAEARWQARRSKNFVEADRLRQELSNHGWIVKDSPTTYTIEKNEP
ncbi:MAG: cysteine--tRNA ligase [Puniceicoccales bacterium]|jgi:cysteinyl-tRNA synthetase|nr:cysteine--tRNA ligase [Puniceicoccales bacterium]